MATHMDFKRLVKDFAKLEGEAVVAIGTTGFAGDGDRMFLNFKEVGLLFSQEDARAILAAAARIAERLHYPDQSLGQEHQRGTQG